MCSSSTLRMLIYWATLNFVGCTEKIWTTHIINHFNGCHYAFYQLMKLNELTQLYNWWIDLSSDADQLLMTCLSIIDGLINPWINFIINWSTILILKKIKTSELSDADKVFAIHWRFHFELMGRWSWLSLRPLVLFEIF